MWVVIVAFSLAWAGSNPNWFAFPLWLLLLALAVTVSWVVVLSMWNKTTIMIDGERLVVRDSPIPIFSNREISRRELEAVYCKTMTEELTQLYSLVARLRSGAEVTILAYLGEPEPCLFAAEEISAYLERTAIDRG
jgi:hypothetical protein